MAQEERRLWNQLLRANVWTAYGSLLALNFGFGLLLRVVLRSHEDDYVGFWGWFFLVSLFGAGYGFVRTRKDRADGIARRPISRSEKLLASMLAVFTIIIVFATDHTSGRMPGRYLVALLVAVLMAVDSIVRHRHAYAGHKR